jgi:hypothetical protein
LKFLGEVWAGWALAGANEVELTKVPKSGGRRRKKEGGNKEKMGTCVRQASNQWSLARVSTAWAGGDQHLPNGRCPQSNIDYVWAPFPKKIGFFLIFFLGSLEMGLTFGRMVYKTPIFWTLPLHLEGWNLPFLIELGFFIFFEIFFG